MREFLDSKNDVEARRNEFYKQVRNELESILQQKGKNTLIKRVRDTISCFENVLGEVVHSNSLLDDLNSHEGAVLIDAIMVIIAPFLDLKFSDPTNFDRAMEMSSRSRIEEEGGYIKLNDLLYYGYGYDPNGLFVHLHVAPAQTLPDKIALLRGGLKRLASQIVNDQRVGSIVATSWIVAEHPRLIERLGFVVDGPIDEQTRKKYFADDSRPISKAHVSREDFLKRYLSDDEVV